VRPAQALHGWSGRRAPLVEARRRCALVVMREQAQGRARRDLWARARRASVDGATARRCGVAAAAAAEAEAEAARRQRRRQRWRRRRRRERDPRGRATAQWWQMLRARDSSAGGAWRSVEVVVAAGGPQAIMRAKRSGRAQAQSMGGRVGAKAREGGLRKETGDEDASGHGAVRSDSDRGGEAAAGLGKRWW
jgi:hypothetical protein